MEHKKQAAERALRLAARDAFVRLVGIRCVDAGPGRATVALTVGDAHINFNGTCHGGVIFTIDRGLEKGSWLDYGMFLQNVMIAARARGLDTCPQVSFLKFHKVIARELALPQSEMLVCGMSLGYADPDAPENSLATPRAPVADFAQFAGFD